VPAPRLGLLAFMLSPPPPRTTPSKQHSGTALRHPATTVGLEPSDFTKDEPLAKEVKG